MDAAVRSLLGKDLTAYDAVQLALLNNLSLQATYQDLGIAQADLVQAGLLKNPVLTVERRFAGQAAEVDVVQDFLELLTIPLRKKIAAAQFEAAKRRVGQAVVDLAADAQSAYYTLQGSEQMLEMRQSVAEATSAAAEASKRIHDAGNSTDLEFRNDQKLALQAKLDLAAAEAEVVLDRERLNVLMGLWGPQTRWTIGNHLPGLPTEEPKGEGLETLAIRQRLDLAASRQEVEVAARSLGFTDATRFFSEITFAVHYEHEIEARHSTGPALNFTVPLFDQGQAAVARGSALLQQSQLRYAAAAVEARSAVRSAYARLITARQRAEYYRREVLPLQAQILEQTQLQYNGMFLGPIQLLQAKQTQIDAGREYIETLRTYWMARTDLEKAVGGKLPGKTPSTKPAAPDLSSPPMGPMRDMPGMKGMDMKGMDMKGMDHKDMPGMK